MSLIFSIGESSGDYHAASLIKALRDMHPSLNITGVGGRLSTEAGLKPLFIPKDLSAMGLSEILPRAGDIISTWHFLKKAFREGLGQAFIPVDYPGMNLRLAEKAKKEGLPVVYFISPKFWAWNYRRIHKIGKLTKMVLCILPFEENLYHQAGYRARYIGNPLVDEYESLPDKETLIRELGLEDGGCYLALLPGSRRHEIESLLPIILEGMKRGNLTEEFHFLIPVARPELRPLIKEIIKRFDFEASLIERKAPEIFSVSRAAVVASGTAALEAALARCPAVIVYRLSPLTYFAGRIMVKIPWVSLPNIILGRPLLPELIQHRVTAERIHMELLLLLEEDRRRLILSGYDEVSEKIGPSGASTRAAELIIETLAGL